MSAMPLEGSRYDLFGVIAGLVPADEIARDAGIERAAGAACKGVYIELSHSPSVQKRDGRDKPGHDDA
jgi:hypothetical protein